MSRAEGAAYAALANDLRRAILQHEFDDGIKLPTEAELADQYKLSRQTVRRAFQDLVADGLVYRVPGRGTFAAPRDRRYLRHFGSVEDLMGLSLDTELEILCPLSRRVDVAAAGRLRLDSDAVSIVTFRRRHDGVPFCVSDVYLPPQHARLLEDAPELQLSGCVSRATVIGLLDARLDRPIVEAEQSITAAAASTDVAQALICPVGAALLRIDRVYLDAAGQPVELAVSYFLPEHYSYRLKLRRSV
jgi:DNA-binding GntR family transcriptional regulator